MNFIIDKLQFLLGGYVVLFLGIHFDNIFLIIGSLAYFAIAAFAEGIDEDE